MAKRKTTEQLAHLKVVASLLAQAESAAAQTANGQIVQVVAALGHLQDIQPEQVREVIGFVDGVMELTKRMAAICAAERREVAAGGEHDSPEDVPASEARAFTGTPEQGNMVLCRSFLGALYNHLIGKVVPSPLKDMISVPDLDKTDRPTHQKGGWPTAGERPER